MLKSEGTSMLPLLQSKDIAYFKKISFKKIKVNDIILAKKKNKVFTHRVIYKNKKYLVTRGDNNLKADGKIYPKNIIGKVYQVKRNGQTFNSDSIYLFQSTIYLQEIVKIKEIFEKEKIDYLFLKGLPLHLYFEKDHPRRVYADCDILISRKSKSKVDNILTSQRFRKEKRREKLKHFQRFIGLDIKELH